MKGIFWIRFLLFLLGSKAMKAPLIKSFVGKETDKNLFVTKTIVLPTEDEKKSTFCESFNVHDYYVDLFKEREEQALEAIFSAFDFSDRQKKDVLMTLDTLKSVLEKHYAQAQEGVENEDNKIPEALKAKINAIARSYKIPVHFTYQEGEPIVEGSAYFFNKNARKMELTSKNYIFIDPHNVYMRDEKKQEVILHSFMQHFLYHHALTTSVLASFISSKYFRNLKAFYTFYELKDKKVLKKISRSLNISTCHQALANLYVLYIQRADMLVAARSKELAEKYIDVLSKERGISYYDRLENVKEVYKRFK